MAKCENLNNFKCNRLVPVHFKGLNNSSQCGQSLAAYADRLANSMQELDTSYRLVQRRIQYNIFLDILEAVLLFLLYRLPLNAKKYIYLGLLESKINHMVI